MNLSYDILQKNNDIDFITLLPDNKIQSMFRNSDASIQNKLWNNDVVQRVLIFGKRDIDILNNSDKIIRNLENLNKVIKSQSIKKSIYSNKYFINFIINTVKFEDRFFHRYDVNKVFDNVISSKEFNELHEKNQLEIIRKINIYSKELLLPKDFDMRYKSIGRIIFSNAYKNISDDIINRLTCKDLFYLELVNEKRQSFDRTKKYIVNLIKKEKVTVEELFYNLDQLEKSYKVDTLYNYNEHYYLSDNKLELKTFNMLLLLQKEDQIIKEELLKYLFCHVSKNSSVDSVLIYNALKRNLNNGLFRYIDFRNLTSFDDNVDIKLIFYIKFNIALRNTRYLNGITEEQLLNINVKHINKLFNLLEDETQDELSSIYGTCIKMYLIFGYERSIEILNNKFGEYNKVFLDNVAKCSVERVPMKREGSKFLPLIDKRFINFMFETPNSNHFINMLNNKDSKLYKRWYHLYNGYDNILYECHNKITLKKVNAILEIDKHGLNIISIRPDINELNNDSFLENIVLGNRTSYSNDKILEKIIEIYRKMKERVESSIPYVEDKTKNGYKYQMMKLDDKQIFELGYKANCCIRTLDIAHNHLLHAALCRNGRILLIYNSSNDLVAFCPMKRNGNVLIVNSIECIDKNLNKIGENIKQAFLSAIYNIVQESNLSEESIDLVCIGREAYLKPKVIPFPGNYITPTIYEKNDEIYQDTDIYHKTLDIVYKKENFNFENIYSKNPNVSYMDPREEVKSLDFKDKNLEDAINVVNSVNYSLDKENYKRIKKYIIKSIYYNKDWYIIETSEGIIGKYLKYDYRAKQEFEEYKNILNCKEEKIKKLTFNQ